MIEIERHPNAVVIRIREKQLQMYAIPQFKETVMPVLSEQPAFVIFEMGAVEHIDSSAMGAIFHFQKFVKEYGGRLGLADISNKVMQVFKVTKSDKNFEVFETVEEALKS